MRVVGSVAPPVEQEAPAATVSRPTPPEPLASSDTAEEETAKKQALAANLEDMIGGMLRTTQFATAATAKTRSSSPQTGEIAAVDTSAGASTFTPNSLVADLARTKPAPAAAATPAEPRRWWIDAVLVLACLLSVLSAGYFTLMP